jgi:uncharacterized phiE125 gp8 family phage protein
MNDYARSCQYALNQYAVPAEEPITVGEAKAQLRIDTTDDDTYLTTLVTAARLYVEGYIGRRLVTQTWDFIRNDFPVGNREMQIPYGPVQSITYIKYIDTGGTLTTMSASDYEVDLYSLVPKVYPAYSLIWPTPRDVRNAVTVRYVAGYGLPSSGLPKAVPENIKHAVKLLVAHLYENREPVLIGTNLVEIPMTIKALLDAERVQWL